MDFSCFLNIIQSITFGYCWLFVKKSSLKLQFSCSLQKGFLVFFSTCFTITGFQDQNPYTTILIPLCSIGVFLGVYSDLYFRLYGPSILLYFHIPRARTFFKFSADVTRWACFFVWDELCLLMAPFWGHVVPMGRQRVFQSVPGTAFATTRSS